MPSSGQDENIISEGSLRTMDFFTYNKLFKNQMNQQLMRHSIYFISQLIFSEAYLGRVIETGKEDTIIEHWIHDIGIDNVSPSVQLPIIKKYTRSVKINMKSINDRYILDMSVFKCLAQAENNSIMKLVDNSIDQISSNLLTFIHSPKVRNDLLKIKDSLESVKNITTYTDRLFKKYTLTIVDIGSAFLISSPKRFEFNINIIDNPSAFKAELIAIILVLLVCPKNANIMIYVDV
ncbi:hypothetical protein C1646_752609 [Rhizophagus diaphanus]|nr:hypothetical protein C1646_752609 [Rhizophagus diaphanus] [Rhizophagus sp. MUCL 43196]